MQTTISETAFGKTATGSPVIEFTLESSKGVRMQVLTLGGIVRSFSVPDASGDPADIVLGFDSLEPYLQGHPYFGAITGRVAGRIPGGHFSINGRQYVLACNDGPNHLHGGQHGLDARLWTPEIRSGHGGNVLQLRYTSPDGEEGYPGAVQFSVTYSLNGTTMQIETEAAADEPTPVSLTHHGYFNLAGHGDVLNHELSISATHIFRCDQFMTPDTEPFPVNDTASDLRQPRLLGSIVDDLFQNHGDLYWLDPNAGNAAVLHDPSSGRTMRVRTDDCCMQFYTGAKLNSIPGKRSRIYGPFAGLCLECQGHPAATGRPELGDLIVYPGKPRRRTTSYTFENT